MDTGGTIHSPEDGFTNMLERFQTTDLQELLASFGIVSFGDHLELKERALSLLRFNPIGLNYQGYLGKIIEIYDRNQRQLMATAGMEQVQLSRPPPPPPPYPNHLTFIPQVGSSQVGSSQVGSSQVESSQVGSSQVGSSQVGSSQVGSSQVGSSQVMPLFQTGIYVNNTPETNNTQYSYISAVPPNIVSQTPQANQQWHTVTPNAVVTDNPSYYNLNQESSFNSNTPHLAFIKLKRLPFYKAKAEIIRPTTLIGHFQCTLRNYPEGLRETQFKFTLSPEQATYIGMNRDISNGKNDYVYQLQIRICHYNPDCHELIDNLPPGLHIRINNKFCPLPPVIHKSRSEIETRRLAAPINCTGLAKFNPNFTNTVIINWFPDVSNYVMAMYLVEKFTIESLLQRLIDKGTKKSEETKIYIREKLAVLDPDLATVAFRVSLVCPLGKSRLQIPAKSNNCDHLQCFDARTYILMNEKKPTWLCPICNQSCLFEDVQIQSYFLEIVSSPNLPDNCKEVELFADGTWKLYEENKEPIEIEIDVEGNPKNSSNDGDENDIEAIEEHNHNLESQKESGNMKSIVDLTLSEDEEP